MAKIQRDIGEQAETLVLAEPAMRKKFVAQDAFTRMLWLNAFGFLILVGIVAGIAAAFFYLKDLTKIGLDRRSFLMFGIMTATVFVGVALAQVVIVPVFSGLLRKWPWWQQTFPQ